MKRLSFLPLVALVLFGCSDVTEPEAPFVPVPQFYFGVSTTAYDFGDVVVGQTESYTITVANEGGITEPNLAVWSVGFAVGSGGDFVLSQVPTTPFILLPGESAAIIVDFSPSALGYTEAFVEISYYDPTLELTTVSLEGTGIPAVNDPPTMLGDLIAEVQDLLADGVLNDGQANSMIQKLEGALAAIINDKPSADNKLNAFINEVEGYINGGNLSESEGQPLIEAAEAIIELIS